MSIAENVGGMSKYLNKIRVGEHYNEFKVDVEHLLKGIPKIGDNLSAGKKGLRITLNSSLYMPNFLTIWV